VSKIPTLLNVLAGVALTLPLFFIGACGPTNTGLCERAAECGGGRDREVDACVIDMDSREEQAELFECVPEWDAYVRCLDDQGTCVDGDRLGGCDTRKDAHNQCIGQRRSGNAKVELKAAE
jgi:hypothetical protein